MPYINQASREAIARGRNPHNAGELNYVISTLIHKWMAETAGGLCYTNLNTAIGMLECAKLELYRMIAAPYEDKKREENGDIGILNNGEQE